MNLPKMPVIEAYITEKEVLRILNQTKTIEQIEGRDA